MSQPYDFIVIGAGVMGSATAYQLARLGRQVLLLEQFSLGHNRGSSHGDSRIIRLSYQHPDYVRLAHIAYRHWAELEADVGEPVLRQVGGLDLGHADVPSLQAHRAAMAESGVSYTEMGSADLRRRFPQFRFDDQTVGVWQADAGILPASRCVALLARQAQRHGAVVHDQEPVLCIIPTSDGVEIVTAKDRYSCARLVITPGAWAGPVLQSLGLKLPLRVTQEQVAFFAPGDASAFEPGRFPVFIAHGARTFYGFPIFGREGVKVAEHCGGVPTTADQRSGQIDPDNLDRVREFIREHLPYLTTTVLHAETCLYTVTPDEDFILDRHPEHPQIVIGAGFSGHGFKFGPAIGRILADLARDEEPEIGLKRFRLSRF